MAYKSRYRSTAAALLLVYVVLVLYATLYPFSGWRILGVHPLDFLHAGWPRYNLPFDAWSNFLGYIPLGLLLMAAWLHRLASMTPTASSPLRLLFMFLVVVLTFSGLSLLLETLQNFLPGRVPSLGDWVLNTTGAAAGAALTLMAQALGILHGWREWRRRNTSPHSNALMVHILLWPLALVFPTAVPFALGQAYERLETALLLWAQGTPLLHYIPLRQFEFEPLLPHMAQLSTVLGLLLPLWAWDLVFAEQRPRLLARLATLVLGVSALCFSSAVSFGPTHQWDWFTGRIALALSLAFALSLTTLRAPARVSAFLLLAAIFLQAVILNQAPGNPYLESILQHWENSRFIRFSGLSQWLGWLWPYLLALFCVSRFWPRKQAARNAGNSRFLEPM